MHALLQKMKSSKASSQNTFKLRQEQNQLKFHEELPSTGMKFTINYLQVCPIAGGTYVLCSLSL